MILAYRNISCKMMPKRIRSNFQETKRFMQTAALESRPVVHTRQFSLLLTHESNCILVPLLLTHVFWLIRQLVVTKHADLIFVNETIPCWERSGQVTVGVAEKIELCLVIRLNNASLCKLLIQQTQGKSASSSLGNIRLHFEKLFFLCWAVGTWEDLTRKKEVKNLLASNSICDKSNQAR